MIILGVMLFSSCGKKRTIVITASNAVTGERYAGLSYLVGSSVTGVDGDEKFRTEASGNLNENGEATVTLRRKSNRTYYVQVSPTDPSQVCYSNTITMYFDSPYDENGHFNFEFAECATLQRKVTNINCFDSNDKIEIYIDNSVHSLISTPWVLNGCADYTTVPTQVPIGTYSLHWIVTKNNISNDYYDTFTLQENENKFYEINY